MTERELLCVDFDNTITQDNVEYWNGEVPEPDEDVIEAVRDHYRSGGLVVVWTARPWRVANLVAARLVEWDVPYHGIRCQKGGADLYIDDKMVSIDEFIEDDDDERLLKASDVEISIEKDSNSYRLDSDNLGDGM